MHRNRPNRRSAGAVCWIALVVVAGSCVAPGPVVVPPLPAPPRSLDSIAPELLEAEVFAPPPGVDPVASAEGVLLPPELEAEVWRYLDQAPPKMRFLAAEVGRRDAAWAARDAQHLRRFEALESALRERDGRPVGRPSRTSPNLYRGNGEQGLSARSQGAFSSRCKASAGCRAMDPPAPGLGGGAAAGGRSHRRGERRGQAGDRGRPTGTENQGIDVEINKGANRECACSQYFIRGNFGRARP